MKLFVVAVCFCFGAGGGPVSFGVGCETVRRRRLCLFWGGRGASQLPGCEGGRAVVVAVVAVVAVVVVVAVCFCFGAGGGPVSFGVGCETVRRRRLFLFWGGRGASQLWSWV